MLAMGEAYAAKIFERMNDHEIRSVAFEMSKIDFITPGMLEAVSLDFVTRFEGESNMVVEGNAFVKHVISSSLDKEKADAIFKDVENRKRDMPFVWSRGINIATLASYIEGEHPQTIAMVLAHMPSDIASEILMLVPDEKRGISP
jgi:flagellar motor switch protein FliG